MSLTSYVENLRERPEDHRKRHAFWWSFGVSAVILAFWIASFTNINIGMGSSGIAEARKFSVATAEKVVSPGTSLVAGVGAFANDVWALIAGPRKLEFSEIEVTAGDK